MTDTATPVPLVLRHDADGVATLTLNRPQARNALSMGLMAALLDALGRVGHDAGIHVVVLAGAGPAFCAGHDLKELRAAGDEATRLSIFQRCADLMLAIQRLRQPVIAKVHGIATAAGCQLVATCDLALAAEGARFAVPGVNIGLFCSTPMVALTRAIPPKAAMEMLLTGEMIGADQAARLGLINRAVPEGQLDTAVADLAGRIAAKAPKILKLGKQAFYRQRELGVEDAYAYTAEVMAHNLSLADAGEGIDAFLGKRHAHWQGLED